MAERFKIKYLTQDYQTSWAIIDTEEDDNIIEKFSRRELAEKRIEELNKWEKGSS